MAYDAVNRIFDNNRAAFIVAGRLHMLHAFCMNHHRVSWSVLRGALNQVMKGTADHGLVNVLVSPSPTNLKDEVKSFKAALQRSQAQKTLTAAETTALETIEGEVFSLPCNLFQGLNARADDPQAKMDFTPTDIQYDGKRVAGNAGDLQKVREQIFGLLSKATIDVDSVKTAVQDWIKLWKAHGGGLTSATPHNAAWWSLVPAAPGAVAAFANPAYRHWLNPDLNRALTSQEAGDLNDVVATRATTKC